MPGLEQLDSLEIDGDVRLAAVLAEAALKAHGPLLPGDIVTAALRLGDNKIREVLAHALPAGHSPDDLVSCWERETSHRAKASHDEEEIELDTAGSFAFHSFGQIMDDLGPAGAKVCLEVLVASMLRHPSHHERKAWPELDREKAIGALKILIDEGLRQQENNDESNDDDSTDEDTAEDPTDNPPIPDEWSNLLQTIIPPEIASSIDLTKRAEQSRDVETSSPFDNEPMYDQLFDQMARGLHRRHNPHLLLIGERGVGKSTILAELAQRMIKGRIGFLADKRLIAVDVRYVAPEESRARLLALMEYIADNPQVIAALDGLANLLTSLQGSNKKILLSILSRAKCRLVGLLTPDEWKEHILDDPEMSEFFTNIDVPEPDIDTAVKLLEHFSIGLQQEYKTRIDADVIRQTVVLSKDYILNDQLPAKALKVLHHLCERADYETENADGSPKNISLDDVIAAISRQSGIPESALRGIGDDGDYEESLRDWVVGQDHVIRDVARQLQLIKAGLTDPTKPASVLLLVGQTGTGKTELAKALARFYSTSKRIKTYTLGNFVESHSVSGLIGVPAGYVGHDQGGRLVNDINSDPYSVFLLDEADKAHPDVLQPLLNLFDEGWVVDQRGIKAYANRSIFLLTTNVGQRMISEMSKRGEPWEKIEQKIIESLTQIKHSKSNRPVFTPEFLARLSGVLIFKPLDADAMFGITTKHVQSLQATWKNKRQKTLLVADDWVQKLAELAFDRNEKSGQKEGGRIVRKLISEYLESSLQQALSRDPAAYHRSPYVIADLAVDRSEEGKSPLPFAVITFSESYPESALHKQEYNFLI